MRLSTSGRRLPGGATQSGTTSTATASATSNAPFVLRGPRVPRLLPRRHPARPTATADIARHDRVRQEPDEPVHEQPSIDRRTTPTATRRCSSSTPARLVPTPRPASMHARPTSTRSTPAGLGRPARLLRLLQHLRRPAATTPTTSTSTCRRRTRSGEVDRIGVTPIGELPAQSAGLRQSQSSRSRRRRVSPRRTRTPPGRRPATETVVACRTRTPSRSRSSRRGSTASTASAASTTRRRLAADRGDCRSPSSQLGELRILANSDDRACGSRETDNLTNFHNGRLELSTTRQEGSGAMPPRIESRSRGRRTPCDRASRDAAASP